MKFETAGMHFFWSEVFATVVVVVALASFELGLIVIQILPVTTVSTTGDVWKIVWRIYAIISSVEGATTIQTMQMNELL